ncbi:hypothetical protein [Acinetobacter junii]|uniref:RipA family octameric membrane protein n=1 Tax=Acinetobacter junii TaxID=40215 RepID=UPI0030F4FB46
MVNKISSDQAVEHAWKYFELHSNQRTTLFNYFLFIMAGLGTAVGVILQADIKYSFVGIFLCCFILLVSFLFWKLDQRTSFLIKQSEKVFKLLERNSSVDIGIFCQEDSNLARENSSRVWLDKIITYGKIFRWTFFITGFIGYLGCIVFILRLQNVLSF